MPLSTLKGSGAKLLYWYPSYGLSFFTESKRTAQCELSVYLYSNHICFKAVYRQAHLREACFVLGHYVALEITVVQIKAHIFQPEAVCRELLDREFEKVHIVRFLMYLAALLQQLFVDLQKALVSQSVRRVGVFRERTAEIQIDEPYRLLGDKAVKVLGVAAHKVQI